MSKRILQLLNELIAGIPEQEWTDLDNLNFARSTADVGEAHIELNMIDEAGENFKCGLEYYRRMGNEETLPSRFGILYWIQMLVLATKGEASDARELARHATRLVSDAVGVETPLTLETKFYAAVVAFTTGDIAAALQLHRDILEVRLRLLGKSHHDTLSSQYNIAVPYQNLGDLENAEYVSVL